MIGIVLSVIYIVMLLAMLYSMSIGNNKAFLILKTALALLFIAIVAILSPRSSYDTVTLIVGMIFCAAGDILLGLFKYGDNKTWAYFDTGVIAFAVAQILYIAFTTVYGGFNIASVFVAVLFALAFTVVKKDVVMHSRHAQLSVIYAMLIITMVSNIIIIDIFSHPPLSALVFTAGAVLFAISDAVLYGIVFDREHYRLSQDYLNKSTYFVGQLLIAVSVAVI